MVGVTAGVEFNVNAYLKTVGGILFYLWVEIKFLEVFTLTFLSVGHNSQPQNNIEAIIAA